MISRIDAWIQKRFDAAVHAFMRATGASKRSIRRNGWGLTLFTSIGLFALGWGHGAWNWLQLFFIVGSIGNLYLDDREDGAAEGAATRSRADEQNLGWKTTGWIATAMSLLIALMLGLDAWRVFDVTSSLSLLFQGYLCNTSPQAPKKQREETPLAQMARAS